MRSGAVAQKIHLFNTCAIELILGARNRVRQRGIRHSMSSSSAVFSAMAIKASVLSESISPSVTLWSVT
jgi:hypothetical protein